MVMEHLKEVFAQLAQDLMVWIGFGTLVGLIAKAILPGKDPGGPIATIFLGIVGSIIGAATCFYFTGQQVEPLSLVGFTVGLAGATLILVCYRVLGGNFLKTGLPKFFKPKPTRRRRVTTVTED